MTERRIHDYRQRYWGHDYTIAPHADPTTADITGWGRGVRQGDVLVIGHPDGGDCLYQIEAIRRPGDPGDMWFATCRFIPASSDLGQRVVAALGTPPVLAPPELEVLTGWRVFDDATQSAMTSSDPTV